MRSTKLHDADAKSDAVLAQLYRRKELVDELIRGLEDYARIGRAERTLQVGGVR